MTQRKSQSSAGLARNKPSRKKYFGRNIHRLGTVSSTQDELKQLFMQGAPEGTIAVAQEQERGRGRREKPWHSQSGRGLWMSVLLQPEGKPEQWTWAPLWAGLVVRRALTDLLKSHAETLTDRILLKWPNDVLLDDRNEVQPDACIWRDEPSDSRLSAEGYLEGAAGFFAAAGWDLAPGDGGHEGLDGVVRGTG